MYGNARLPSFTATRFDEGKWSENPIVKSAALRT